MTNPPGQPASKPRVRRHLIDPDNPPRPRSGSSMSITQVQRWVLSALAVTTILHLSAGLMIAAIFLDEDRLDGRIGLNVIAGVVAIGAVVVARAIHQKSVLSPWLLLGVVPTVVGLYLTF